ncbi:hypothetical protein G6F58_013700 [Rhizopus delemar]|nr:hypothetical protein G6F58_013700 [Rhizopus delemar]
MQSFSPTAPSRPIEASALAGEAVKRLRKSSLPIRWSSRVLASSAERRGWVLMGIFRRWNVSYRPRQPAIEGHGAFIAKVGRAAVAAAMPVVRQKEGNPCACAAAPA